MLMVRSMDVLELRAEERSDEPLNDRHVRSKSDFFEGKLSIDLLDDALHLPTLKFSNYHLQNSKDKPYNQSLIFSFVIIIGEFKPKRQRKLAQLGSYNTTLTPAL